MLWVDVLDQVTGMKRSMPPRGFVAGIYVRNNLTREVRKAPANEAVLSAVGIEAVLDKSQLLSRRLMSLDVVTCQQLLPGHVASFHELLRLS